MALNSRIELGVVATLTGTADLATPTSALSYAKQIGLASGTGANQADLIWHDQRTLTTAANEDLDLAGSLTALLGGTLTIVKLKGVIVFSLPANTTNLTVSRPASNGVPFFAAASDAVVVTPGGVLVLINPSAAAIAVTAGTGDLINIANAAGASATYDVILIGTSA